MVSWMICAVMSLPFSASATSNRIRKPTAPATWIIAPGPGPLTESIRGEDAPQNFIGAKSRQVPKAYARYVMVMVVYKPCGSN